MKNIGDDLCNVCRLGDRLGQVTKMFVTGRSLIGTGLKDIVAICRASEMFAADMPGVFNPPILHRAEALVTFDVNVLAVMPASPALRLSG